MEPFRPRSLCRFARTLILIPTCFMFWMIAANYYGAEIPSAAPMGTMRALLLLTNIACLIVLRPEMFARQAGPCSHVRSHATTNAAIIICCFADMGVRDDVAGRPGWYGDFIRERRRGGAGLARCAAPATARI